jgi:hypothetical protein
MGRRGEVLIAIMNNVLDMAIANNSTVVFWHFRPKCDTFGVISITWVKT